MHVMASWDGTGHQWSEPLVLYEGQTSGYSNLQALADDRFRVVYQEGTFDAYQEGGSESSDLYAGRGKMPLQIRRVSPYLKVKSHEIPL